MPAMPKPVRGTAILAARERRAGRRRHEQREMQAALRRDDRRCRFPRCAYVGQKLPIDAAHLLHRGSGGNPKGDRTQRHLLISLCRVHHGLLDAALLQIEPLTADGTDGPCAFSEVNPETGRWEVFASEVRLGVSVERGVSA